MSVTKWLEWRTSLAVKPLQIRWRWQSVHCSNWRSTWQANEQSSSHLTGGPISSNAEHHFHHDGMRASTAVRYFSSVSSSGGGLRLPGAQGAETKTSVAAGNTVVNPVNYKLSSRRLPRSRPSGAMRSNTAPMPNLGRRRLPWPMTPKEHGDPFESSRGLGRGPTGVGDPFVNDHFTLLVLQVVRRLRHRGSGPKSTKSSNWRWNPTFRQGCHLLTGHLTLRSNGTGVFRQE